MVKMAVSAECSYFSRSTSCLMCIMSCVSLCLVLLNSALMCTACMLNVHCLVAYYFHVKNKSIILWKPTHLISLVHTQCCDSVTSLRTESRALVQIQHCKGVVEVCVCVCGWGVGGGLLVFYEDGLGKVTNNFSLFNNVGKFNSTDTH